MFDEPMELQDILSFALAESPTGEATLIESPEGDLAIRYDEYLYFPIIPCARGANRTRTKLYMMREPQYLKR